MWATAPSSSTETHAAVEAAYVRKIRSPSAALAALEKEKETEDTLLQDYPALVCEADDGIINRGQELLEDNMVLAESAV